MTRRRRVALPFVSGAALGLLTLIAYYAGAHADALTGSAPPEAAAVDDVARWWRSGVLAGPIALAVYGLLAVGVVLSRTRWPGLAWLRRGRVQATIAVVAANLSATILPSAIAGTLTMPMLFSAIATLGFLGLPGGMERKPEDVPT